MPIVSDGFILIFMLVTMHTPGGGLFCQVDDVADLPQMEQETQSIKPKLLPDLRRAYTDAKAARGAEPSTYEVIYTLGHELDVLSPGLTMYGDHPMAPACPSAVPADTLSHQG